MSFHSVPAGVRPVPLASRPQPEPGQTALLCAKEPLDLLGGTHLQERARPLYSNTRCLVLDLQRAEYVDSAGVRALLRIAEELEAQDKELRLVIAEGSRVERTLRLLRLTERFRVFHRLNDAWTGRGPTGETLQ